jgi:hypothetical protein
MDDVEGPQCGGSCDSLGESLSRQHPTAFYGEDIQPRRPAHQILEVPVLQTDASHSNVGHMVERMASGRGRDVVHVVDLQGAQLLQSTEGAEVQQMHIPGT